MMRFQICWMCRRQRYLLRSTVEQKKASNKNNNKTMSKYKALEEVEVYGAVREAGSVFEIDSEAGDEACGPLVAAGKLERVLEETAPAGESSSGDQAATPSSEAAAE